MESVFNRIIVLQSNCQTCEVTKDVLDDEEDHETRHKLRAAHQMRDATRKGIFPRWEAEPGAKDQPKPIYTQFGTPPKIHFSAERVQRAEAALGIKLVVNSTWIFPHFDCYVQVFSGVCFVNVFSCCNF